MTSSEPPSKPLDGGVENMSPPLSTDKEFADMTTTTTTTTTTATKTSKSKATKAASSAAANTSETNSLLIQKCSIFDSKPSKALLDSIVEVIEGFHDDGDLSGEANTRRRDVGSPPSAQKAAEDAFKRQIESIEHLTVSDKLFCTTCNMALGDRDEQLEHYKCDLHLFNLKQKLKGRPAVGADEFEQLVDISSISGSEDDYDSSDSSSSSSSDDDTSAPHYAQVARSKPKISFRLEDNSVVVMLRCILHGKKDLPDTQQTLLNRVKSINANEKWCVILVAAGHFAAAIFKGDQVVVHKTFHRYVVRAKRGTVQSQHDASKGKNAKSVGANIRRQQESAFKEDIRMLLGSEWKDELSACKCIFLRVPQYNRSVLIAGTSVGNEQQQQQQQQQAPFGKDDVRIRHIPFMTFRPTFNEVKRAHALLGKLEHYQASYVDVTRQFSEKLNSSMSSSKRAAAQAKSKSKSASKSAKANKAALGKEAEAEEPRENGNAGVGMSSTTPGTGMEESSQIGAADDHADGDGDVDAEFIHSMPDERIKLFNEIYTATHTNNVAKLDELLAAAVACDSARALGELLNKRVRKDQGTTLLHMASQLGHSECIWSLLTNGADPAVADLTRQKRVPYTAALNKPTRDQFRRFMNDFPERYDYTTAQISSPLTAEQLAEKAEKEKEKKKQQRKLKKERDTQLKSKQQEEAKRLESELAERQKYASLGDADKLALIRQQAGQQSRCWFCGLDLAKIAAPFHYYDMKFCSNECLKQNRAKSSAKSK